MKIESLEPQPIGNALRHAGHHWLEVRDGDGHTFGMVVMQWSPTHRRWYHSGTLATLAKPVDTTCWRYVAEAPMPELGL